MSHERGLQRRQGVVPGVSSPRRVLHTPLSSCQSDPRSQPVRPWEARLPHLRSKTPESLHTWMRREHFHSIGLWLPHVNQIESIPPVTTHCAVCHPWIWKHGYVRGPFGILRCPFAFQSVMCMCGAGGLCTTLITYYAPPLL